MELKYVKAMQQYGIAERNLPQDAKIGIKQIKSILNKIEKAENSGKNVSQQTLNKVSAMDKWIYYEILDMVNETDKNDDEMPYDEEEIDNEIDALMEEDDDDEDDDDEQEEEEEEDDEDDEQPIEDEEEEEEYEQIDNEEAYQKGDSLLGEKIESDLQEIYASGKRKITMDELKSLSKNTYDIVFNNYDESGDNGVVTNQFELIETNELEFTLTRK